MSGLIAKKVGMSRIFLSTGEAVPVTYLEVEPNIVVRTKTKEKDGYDAVVLGIGAKPWKSRKGKDHVRYLRQKEWRVESLEGMEPGKNLTAELLPPETLVTVTSTSKGKGFQGVMRRHHFAGGPASHGSHFKREPGSVGMRTQPGRILKGHRMAGHMGLDTVTMKHRHVVAMDAEKGILAVKGPVPGPNGAIVYLTKEASPSAS
jgi:large subunit ribosomal protein L3